jgi:hypothetical protein
LWLFKPLKKNTRYFGRQTTEGCRPERPSMIPVSARVLGYALHDHLPLLAQ